MLLRRELKIKKHRAKRLLRDSKKLLRDAKELFAKTEEDLMFLQSVGQLFGEVLLPLDNERC